MATHFGHHPSPIRSLGLVRERRDERLLKKVAAAFAVHDWILFGYLALLFFLTLVHHSSTPSTLPITLTAANVILFVAVLSVARIVPELRHERGVRSSPPSLAISILYRLSLVALPIASYIGLRWVLPVIAPRTLDHQLLSFDLRVFGVEPALALDGWVTPGRTEWFSFFYFSYFILLAAHAIPIALFARDGRLLREFSLGVLSIFCAGQLIYILVPGVGPSSYEGTRDMFASRIEGAIFWPLVRDTVATAGALRDIFPSMHAGLPVFLTMFAFRYRDRAPLRYTWLLTGFFATQIIIATMYLRWHYLIDIIAGVTLAIVLTLLSRPIARWEEARQRQRFGRSGQSARSVMFGRALPLSFVATVVLLLVGCSGGSSTPLPSPANPLRDVQTNRPSPDLIVDKAPESDDERILSFDVRVPKRVRWSPSTLGPVKPTLVIMVTNRSKDQNVNITNFHVHLLATREGIAFRCAQNIGPSRAAGREPNIIHSGASVTIEREVDCALPLTGKYAVRISVSYGPENARRQRALSAFMLSVTSSENVEPRPILGVRGAWAAIGSSNLLVGASSAGTETGRIAVTIVNGSATTLKMPPMKLALRVYRRGSSIPCLDTPTRLKTPNELASGASYREPIDVSCLGLGAPGHYEVVAHLLVEGADGAGETIPTESEIGRLRIEISSDPSRRTSPLF